MKIILHRLAREELIAAAQYLDAEARLGAEFLAAFADWAEQARRFPESGPVIGHQVRKGVIARFHYVIAYEIRLNEIRVLYLRHAKQKTPDWDKRR